MIDISVFVNINPYAIIFNGCMRILVSSMLLPMGTEVVPRLLL